jgi:hypothetical protein
MIKGGFLNMSGLDEQFFTCDCDSFWGWKIRGVQLLGWILVDKSHIRKEKGHGIVHLHERFHAVRHQQEPEEIIIKINTLECIECKRRYKAFQNISKIKDYMKRFWYTSRSYRLGAPGRYIMTHDEKEK